MRALSAVLNDLLTVAELVVARPLASSMAFDRVKRFRDLAIEMRRHDDLPAEDVRSTRGGVGLVVALEAHWQAQGDRDETRAALWLSCVGMMLPIVRIEAAMAFNSERTRRA